ncbi:MAG: glycosyltransferase family 4 protein [Caldilineaceae bacterium]|nr:glycosyltransferase family 4 protein [Caldilineaceae bacterium]
MSEDSKPYFLYVGHRTPYKNFIRLLDAFGQAKLGHRFDLVAISPSGASFTAEEERSIARHGIAQSVRLRFSPSDDELRATYARAFAFVYPSLYEGFGLPILEAFASGVLVCASNTASMPELGGEAALYFEPEVVDSIAATLIQAASLDEDERHARIRAGIERARFFTWERCVIRTMDILRELACEQRPRR